MSARMSAIVRDHDQPLEPCFGFAGIDRLGGKLDAVLQRLGFARDHQSRCGIKERDVAKRGILAGEDAAQGAGIRRRIAAAQGFRLGARQADVLGRNLEARDDAIFEWQRWSGQRW